MRAPASLLHRRAAGETSSSPAPQPQEMAPTMAVDSDGAVILASLLCMIVCVVGLALLSRWACRRHHRASSSNRGPPPPPKGLAMMAIDALPTVSFTAVSESSSSECVICLAEFAQGEGVRVLPRCGHGFHVACIDAWLCKQATCPSCRVVMFLAPTAQVVVAADIGEEAAHTSTDQTIAHG